jgi:hypothetical protein
MRERIQALATGIDELEQLGNVNLGHFILMLLRASAPSESTPDKITAMGFRVAEKTKPLAQRTLALGA